MEDAVLVFSGGVDSVTLLYHMVRDLGIRVHTLSFDYGQKHRTELSAAKRIADIMEVDHRLVDISAIQDLISKGSLTGGADVPKAHYDDETQKQTIVPNRNMIMLSIAVGYAVTIGAKRVYYAAHMSDRSIYPDCRKEFVKALDTAVYLGNLWDPVEISAPFVDMTKVDIVGEGLRLGVPYKLTWSCYEGSDRPCLECGTCRERTEAFQINGEKDPLLTDEEWESAVKRLGD